MCGRFVLLLFSRRFSVFVSVWCSVPKWYSFHSFFFIFFSLPFPIFVSRCSIVSFVCLFFHMFLLLKSSFFSSFWCFPLVEMCSFIFIHFLYRCAHCIASFTMVLCVSKRLYLGARRFLICIILFHLYPFRLAPSQRLYISIVSSCVCVCASHVLHTYNSHGFMPNHVHTCLMMYDAHIYM